MTGCQLYHQFCADVTWDKLAWDLLGFPAVVQVCLVFLMIPISRSWWSCSKRPFALSVRRLVGNDELTVVHHPNFLKACFILEIILSMWFAGSWAFRTYSHDVLAADHRSDQVLCVFFLFTYCMNAARNNFSVGFTLRPSSIITVLTVVPTFFRNKHSTSLWFSFGYLRASNAVIAVNKIEKMGALNDVGDITRMYIQLSLRTFALVACLVGTVFTLEVLGDPDSLQDEFIQTEMGGLSVIQLFYWIITTISTVGYGDYAPKTVLSRLFIIVAIVVGVWFFTEEINEVISVYATESSGRGRYKQTSRGSDHVVLIGGGVGQFSSVIQSLMNEVFAADEERWPDLVIMSNTEQPEQLRQAIKNMPKEKRQRIKFFMGDPTEPRDMTRVRMDEADLLIIIPSLLAADVNAEDEANILRGLAVKNCYPQINMRLMLLRSANKKVAVQVGFPPSRCFSINEQKSGLFALSCYCRGFSTMITHFLMADSSEDDRIRAQTRHGKARPVSEWVHTYREGRKFHLCGFVVQSKYVGISFSQFAILSTKRNITPIAIQIKGRIHLAPEQHTLEMGDIVFALVRTLVDLVDFREPKSNWRQTFKERQQQAQEDARRSFYMKERASSCLFGGRVSNPGASGLSPTHQTPVKKPGFVNGLTHTLTMGLPPTPMAKSSSTAPMCAVRSASVLKTEAEKRDELDTKLHGLESKGKCIAETGDHFILVLLQGAPWNQVRVFLSTLRAHHLPFHIPILVVLHFQSAHPEQLVALFEAYPRTGVLRTHNNVGIHDLRLSGMERALCIALLAGQSNTCDRHDVIDGPGVTLMACIEGELMDCTRSIPVFLELHHQQSVRFLSRFFHRDAVQNDQDDSYDPTETFTNHPRFANGTVFTASVFGATVARSFNMPGIVELMEAITLGFDSQTSFPWQVSCPEGFAGRNYGELTHHFLETYSAICLGLFRLCFDSSSEGPRFVITNPEQEIQLRQTDWLFVLANERFGQECYARKMLVGANSAPAANVPEEYEEQPDTEQPMELVQSALESVPSCQSVGDSVLLGDQEGDNDNDNDYDGGEVWASCRIHDHADEPNLPQLRTPSHGITKHHGWGLQDVIHMPVHMSKNPFHRMRSN